MRLALVVPGGVDRSAQERVIPVLLWIIERLARNHTLHVFAFRQYPLPCSYTLLGAEVHNLGEEAIRRSVPAGFASMKLAQSLIREMDRTGPFDLVHAFWGGTSGAAAGIAARWLKMPLVLSLAGGELVGIPDIHYGSQLTLRGRILVRLSTVLADQVTVATSYMNKLANQKGVRAVEIPLGVDPQLAGPQKVMKSSPPWQLLHVGSLNKVKDLESLINAMRIVTMQLKGARLDLIGEDTLGGEVQVRCTELGLDSVVTFHGFKRVREIQPFFRQADILLVSSRHEAGPLVVLEAAAHGVPTVGTAVGHVADFSPDKSMAVAIKDPGALANEVIRLLRDGAQRAALGLAAQEWVQAHSIDWTVEQFESLYSDLLSAR